MRSLVGACIAAIVAGFLIGASQAQYQSFPPGVFSNKAALDPAAGGASPTWTGQAAAANGSCGFVTTCNATTTGTVTTGVVVAMAGVSNAGASSGTITGISVCGTALTVDVAPSIASNAYGAAIGHGSVTGGTCTVSVTFSVSGSIQNGGVAWGTLNNLNSSTPGSSCSAIYHVSQNSPYPCTGGLIVSSGGFGIVGYFDNGSTVTNGGSLTVDATANNSGGTGTAVAIGHVTASCTAAQCQYAAANFADASVIGEPFR